MRSFLEELKAAITSGTARFCITGNILQDVESSERLLRSICLTMVSADLVTISADLIYFIGHMSQTYGQQCQEISTTNRCRDIRPAMGRRKMLDRRENYLYPCSNGGNHSLQCDAN